MVSKITTNPKAVAAAVDFWLVRHGQTFANFEKVMQGH